MDGLWSSEEIEDLDGEVLEVPVEINTRHKRKHDEIQEEKESTGVWKYVKHIATSFIKVCEDHWELQLFADRYTFIG